MYLGFNIFFWKNILKSDELRALKKGCETLYFNNMMGPTFNQGKANNNMV